MTKKIFIANWKMYLHDGDALNLARAYVDIGSACDDWIVAVAPTFTALERVGNVIKSSGIFLASQNGFWEEGGAFTGEISMTILAELGVRFVILGHSEQRKYRNVTNKMIAKSVRSAVKHDIRPVICIGETKEEKLAGKRKEVIEYQLISAIERVREIGRVVVAYEPRWAIGSGEPCSPAEASLVHAFVRSVLEERFGSRSADKVPILYGGSVNGENIKSYLKEELIAGVLVGGASTKSKDVKKMLCGA